MSQRADVSIIIPQYGRVEQTLRCLRSFREVHQQLPEIIVVDDGSPQPELQRLQDAAIEGVEAIRQRCNRGVTAAWNQGALYASGRILIFLNNDVRSHGPWYERLIEPLNSNTAQIRGVRPRHESHIPPKLKGLLTESRLLEGWCLAICRRRFFQLGQFDQRFRLYFSDTDLQFRLLSAFRDGAQLSASPGLPVQHTGHQTTSGLAERRQVWLNDRKSFMNKWFKGME